MCDKQTYLTTNIVDVHWDVCVIEKSSTTTDVVDDTTFYSSASAPSWTQSTVVDGYKFSVARHLSWRLLNRSKNTISTYPTALDTPAGMISLEYYRDLLPHKTRVPSLSSGVVCVIIHFHLVMDEQIDGQTHNDCEYHASIASCGKNKLKVYKMTTVTTKAFYRYEESG